MRMAGFLGAVALAMITFNGEAHAQAWCLVDDAGRTNCAYANQQQCLATSRGDGGFCQENTGYYTNKEPRWKQNRRRNTYDSGRAPAPAPAPN